MLSFWLPSRVSDDVDVAEETVRAGVQAAAELVSGMRLASGALGIHDEGGWLVERVPIANH